MPWQCKLLDIIKTELVEYNPPIGHLAGETLLVDSSGNKHRLKELPIGTMFYLPNDINIDSDDTKFDWPWYMAKKYKISDYYFQNNSQRRPLFIVLPNNTLFLIDGKCWSNGQHYGGWTVTGEAPNITVSPSINISHTYHGWIQNGILSDDCEGRTF